MTYQSDLNLNEKLAEWEALYNFAKPHSAMNGKIPYERYLEKMG